ncbi:unnamed protein product [Caenorhabditis auriculariae]|uniref:Roadblock/LAMTOR2 domain-containing protein n=1 Tax=Caenorhabditis auriculariae TaxID=2777116 RepID=A0A8S1GUK4_9PELO|nr:unnamed protein product [Caenorhabditis auriculariae]
MLKQKALIQVLEQANTNEVTSAILFNKEGLLLGQSGEEVSPTWISSIWACFDRRDLNESIIVMDEGIIGIAPVANMLLALKASKKAEIGMVRAKLRAMAKYLEGPISMIERDV